VRGLARGWLGSAWSLLIIVLTTQGAHAGPDAPPRSVIDWLDPAAVLDYYFHKESGSAREPRFYVQARLKAVLTIPIGDVHDSSSGYRKPSFSLSIVDVEDLRQDHPLRLVYLGTETLDRLGYFADRDYCLQYEPFKGRTATLGDLLGVGEPFRVPPVPLVRLHDLRLEGVDGVLVRIPGTSNICTSKQVYVITVLSPDGSCREIVEGAKTTYVCEHRIGESLRSMASMAIDPAMNPTSSCMATKGAGSCLIFDYPDARPAPAPR
jgi:hypothetical protein